MKNVKRQEVIKEKSLKRKVSSSSNKTFINSVPSSCREGAFVFQQLKRSCWYHESKFVCLFSDSEWRGKPKRSQTWCIRFPATSLFARVPLSKCFPFLKGDKMSQASPRKGETWMSHTIERNVQSYHVFMKWYSGCCQRASAVVAIFCLTWTRDSSTSWCVYGRFTIKLVVNMNERKFLLSGNKK